MQQASRVRYVVRFGAGTARRFLAHAGGTLGDAFRAPENGWGPLIWVKDFARAETFGSAEEARAFAVAKLTHSRWEIGAAARSDHTAQELAGALASLRLAA